MEQVHFRQAEGLRRDTGGNMVAWGLCVGRKIEVTGIVHGSV